MSEPDPPRETWDEDTYQHLRLTRQGFAAIVTLDRPELHNAFNERLIGEIQRAFERLSEAEDIRAVVLQGAGKSFCAGADLNWMRASLDFTHDENIADALKLLGHAARHRHLPPSRHRTHPRRGARRRRWTHRRLRYRHHGGGTRFGFTEARLGIAPAVISHSSCRRLASRMPARSSSPPSASTRSARSPSGWFTRSSRSTNWTRR